MRWGWSPRRCPRRAIPAGRESVAGVLGSFFSRLDFRFQSRLRGGREFLASAPQQGEPRGHHTWPWRLRPQLASGARGSGAGKCTQTINCPPGPPPPRAGPVTRLAAPRPPVPAAAPGRVRRARAARARGAQPAEGSPACGEGAYSGREAGPAGGPGRTEGGRSTEGHRSDLSVGTWVGTVGARGARSLQDVLGGGPPARAVVTPADRTGRRTNALAPEEQQDDAPRRLLCAHSGRRILSHRRAKLVFGS